MKMMYRRNIGLVLLATAVVCGSVSSASPAEQRTRAELQTWYGKIVDAYKRKDIKAYMALFTTDYRIYDFQGKVKDRQALAAAVKSDMATMGTIHSAVFDITKLDLKDKAATFEGIETWRYILIDRKGEYGPKGKSYNVVWRSSLKGMFVKTSHGWMAKYDKATGPETLTTGGKPMVPLAAHKRPKS